MKISFLNKYIQTKSADPVKEQITNLPRTDSTKASQKSKVDSTQISESHSSGFDDKRLTVAKSSILYDVTVGTSPKRIAELKTSVENGTYKVPTDALAEAMLK